MSDDWPTAFAKVEVSEVCEKHPEINLEKHYDFQESDATYHLKHEFRKKGNSPTNRNSNSFYTAEAVGRLRSYRDKSVTESEQKETTAKKFDSILRQAYPEPVYREELFQELGVTRDNFRGKHLNKNIAITFSRSFVEKTLHRYWILKLVIWMSLIPLTSYSLPINTRAFITRPAMHYKINQMESSLCCFFV